MSESTAHQAIEKILNRAAQQGVSAEVYFLEQDDTPIEFETNRLKSLQTKAKTGLALRVISEDRLGFASSTDLGRTDELFDAALQTASTGDPAQFDFASSIKPGPAPVPYTAPPADHFIDTGNELIAHIRDEIPDVIVSAGFTVRRSRIEIATTAGARGLRQRTTVSASLAGNLVRGEDILEAYSYATLRDGEPDYDQLVQEVLTKFRRASRTAQVSSGALPVLFTPQAAASTLGSLFRTVLSGQAVVQKSSPLADKVGQAIFNSQLTLYEDPEQGTGAAAFDDEGTPTQAKWFIDEGTVRDFYWDRTWAARAGVPLTGNGFRNGLGRPAPGTVNLCMVGGELPEEVLVRTIKEGLIVEQVLGAGQSNQLAGEFSVNLDLGYKVENGEIVGRVKNTMVAGNIFEAFGPNLAALSYETQWVFGSALMPSILFRELGVAARD